MTNALAFEQHLQSRRPLIEAAAAQNRTVELSIWKYLQDSEQQLIGLMNGNPPLENAPGSIEYSWCLYYLNHKAPDWLTKDLRQIGLPHSNIQPTDWTKWETILAGNGVLTGDGTLVSTALYATIDPGWALAIVDFFLVHLGLISLHDFTTTGPVIPITGKTSLSVALFGDWGTGAYQDGTLPASPSQMIMQQIQKAAPDISIHLGDVYYSGTQGLVTKWGEEYRNLVDCWSYVAPSGNFTLNSNHEMYDGGNGLFKVALNTSVTPIFSDQAGSTFFTISFGNWLIIGLDSAYNATSMYMVGAITDEYQLSVLKQAGGSGKKIMILTHHNPITEAGSALNGTLWSDVTDALGKQPDYWYWGHIHNGIVYSSAAAGGACSGTACRCLGNAAIPIGNATWFNETTNKNVEFYTNKLLNESYPGNNPLRVQNGYAILTFTEDAVTEQWYYQDGTVAWPAGSKE